MRTMPTLERLEGRDCPAVLDISPAGALTFVDGAGENNTVSVAVAAGVYSLADRSSPITLGAGAVAAGWANAGANAASGPASALSSLSISPGGGANAVGIRSTADPVTIDGGTGVTAVVLSSTGGLIGNMAGIGEDIAIVAGSDTSVYCADYNVTARAGAVAVGPGGVSGLGAHSVNWSGTLSLLRVVGSNSSSLAESYEIDSPDAISFRLDCGGGDDTVTVSGDAAGDIYLGGGDDSLTVSDGATLTGDAHTGGQAGDQVFANLGGYGIITGSIGA